MIFLLRSNQRIENPSVTVIEESVGFLCVRLLRVAHLESFCDLARILWFLWVPNEGLKLQGTPTILLFCELEGNSKYQRIKGVSLFLSILHHFSLYFFWHALASFSLFCPFQNFVKC